MPESRSSYAMFKDGFQGPPSAAAEALPGFRGAATKKAAGMLVLSIPAAVRSIGVKGLLPNKNKISSYSWPLE
ncbi:hypothetical protein KNP414_06491 [Paenibacillus mucilaginosus KNP414]|uniref:Uncharacterized protein n=1 Tax=Paenibacillus mucilaginosus (strain KNP414) TaxID=1036673 RepID=F8FNU3_PAEMK|nr:hypothetical protein KNP414_06491 [Paenibacillus mucilaginosus KNP414]